jgi:peptidoglycan/LPS O-acetylase OafA/YrhL
MSTLKAEISQAALPTTSPKIAAAKPPRLEIGSLTAIRFFPIFAVMLDHVLRFTTHQAVSFFFILSGFVLALSHFDINLERKTLIKFSVARVARLWPSHVICLLLLIFSCPEAFKLTNSQIPKFLTNLFLLQAWVPNLKIFFSYNAPSWASSVLIFTAVAFPVLAVTMRKSWQLAVALTAVPLIGLVVACNIMALPEYSTTGLSMQGLLYINPLARVFEFAAGMAAAVAFRSISTRREWTGRDATMLEVTALALLAVTLATATQMQQASTAWLGTAGAYWLRNVGSTLIPCSMLFIALALNKGFFARALDNRPMRFLGEVTFSIYMLHAVLLAYKSIHYPNADPMIGFVVWFFVLMIGSIAMYKYVETPLRKLIVRLGAKLV